MAAPLTSRGRSGMTAAILKVMGIFGGVQVLTILCAIVRTKFVALWIGPAGVGLFGIYNSALDTVKSVAQLGIGESAVRDLSNSPRERLAAVVLSLRRWSWALGVIGAALMLAFSGMLSRFSFGDTSHAWGFMLLSVCVLLSSLSSAEGAVFRGFRRFRKLARASVWGAVGGLAVSLPMFYFWGERGIVPSIIAYTVVTWLALGLYREKVGTAAGGRLAWGESFAIGKGFVVLGTFMTASMFLSNLSSYVFLAWLNNDSGESAVGLYQAGFTLVNKYVGLVFTAIAVEYYPRLAAVAHSPRRLSLFAGHEIRLVMWILLPAVSVFILADELVVRLLYSSDFLEMLPFVSWGAVGTIFRAFGWCVGFTILAKGDGATYLWTEALSAAVSLVLNIVAFTYWSWTGVGVAYIAWYAVYSIVVAAVARHRYALRLSRTTVGVSLLALAATFMAALLHAGC